jgi:hypothetical protein
MFCGLVVDLISALGIQRATTEALYVPLSGQAPPIWQGKACQTRTMYELGRPRARTPIGSGGPPAGLLEAPRLSITYSDLPTHGDSRLHRSGHLDIRPQELPANGNSSRRALELIVPVPRQCSYYVVCVASPIRTTRQRLTRAKNRINWRRHPWSILGFAHLGSPATRGPRCSPGLLDTKHYSTDLLMWQVTGPLIGAYIAVGIPK